MDKRQIKTVRRFRSVDSFLSANRIVSNIGDITAPLAELRETVDRIARLSLEQEEARRLAESYTVRATHLQRVVRAHHLRPIAHVAKLVLPARKSDALAFAALPTKCKLARVIGAARAMAEACDPYAAGFVRAGLHTDFIDRLTAGVRDLEEQAAQRALVRVRRAAATRALKVAFRRGRVLVAFLDAIVRPAMAYDKAALTRWRAAAFGQRKRKSAKVADASQTGARAAGPGLVCVGASEMPAGGRRRS